MTERERLERELHWLKSIVQPGFEKRKWPEAVHRVMTHIDDLEWRLETDPIRPAPQCGWPRRYKDKPYRQHGENCPSHYKRCQDAFDQWREARARKDVSRADPGYAG